MVTDMPLADETRDFSLVSWPSLARLTHKYFKALVRCAVTHGRSRTREKDPRRETKGEFQIALWNAVAQIVGTSASQRLLKLITKFTDPFHHKCTA
jgi:hypothetical protein